MCGIAGILDWHQPVSRDALNDMLRELARRGPDAQDTYLADYIGLGHRRLAIIDTSSAGTQPMRDVSNNYTVVFNGEIYNYQELRTTLTKIGASFHSKTDTEVILEAYKAWGDDCVLHLNGMFAFAIWDAPRNRLFLARDRMGEKPLYYAHLPNGGFIFASELKSVLSTNMVANEISMTGLSHYLSLGYVMAPHTLVASVYKLEPAHIAVLERDRPFKKIKYWHLENYFHNKSKLTEKQACKELNELLEDSIKLRMISDVPLGVFLSGGIDSATIVAGMKRIAEVNNEDAHSIHSFSAGFVEKSYSELEQADEVARFLGVSNFQRLIIPNFEKDFLRIFDLSDEPIGDNSLIPMYYLSQFARERVTVALSGDGGDELFGGYETYVADKYHRMLTQIVPRGVIKLIRRMFDSSFPVSFNKVSFDFKARRFLNGLLLPPERAHYSWRQYLSDDEKSACLNPDIAREVMLHDPFDVFKKHFAEVSSCHYLDQAMYVDMHTWLPNAILVKADRSSMANSLELRCPFLDHRLVQFAAALPIELKINIFNKKYILKRSQAAILPPSLLSRPKKGFNAPVANWLTTNLKDIFEQIVAGSTETNDILNKNFLTTLLEDHLERRRDNSFIIFNLIGLMQWLGNQRTGNRSATNLAAN